MLTLTFKWIEGFSFVSAKGLGLDNLPNWPIPLFQNCEYYDGHNL